MVEVVTNLNTETVSLKQLCRICLTYSDVMFLLSDLAEVESSNEPVPVIILNMLENTFEIKINADEQLPSNICSFCLKNLMLAYKFRAKLLESQKALNACIYTSDICVSEKNNNTEKASAVEVIVGKRIYTLKDLLIVENEFEEKNNYTGFLNNLGSEVSIKFANKNKSKSSKSALSIEESVSIIPCATKRTLKKIESADCELRTSQNNCNANDLFGCVNCKKTFLTRKNLKNHLKLHTKTLQKSAKTTFLCQECGEVTNNRSAANYHELTHKEKKFKCTKCNKRFISPSALKIHFSGHINNRLFLCSICGKNFNYSSALKYHMRTHTGERNYSCQYCGMKFTMGNALKRHIRTHTGVKPYTCEFCDKGFASSGELKSHEMIHTGRRPYRCKFCDKGFTKSHNLKVHLSAHPNPH